jgi:hypothetical protein
VVAGADDVVDALFHDAGLFAVEAELGAALKELAVALEHRVVQAGGLVIECVRVGVVLDDVGQGRLEEGAPHAGLRVGGGDLLMAACALSAVDVGRLRSMGGS